jgi:cellulose synthase operon protein C
VKRASLVLLLLALASCATAPPLVKREGPAWDGWRELAAGNDDVAAAAFARAPADPLAAFGQASLAFERGDGAAAIDGYLRVLETPAASSLAPAAAARVAALLDDVADRAPAEARLAALPRARLPWVAQLALAEIAGETARRKGDAELLAADARRAGCLTELSLLGLAGRLPHLDLAGELVRPTPRRLPASGCRVLLPALEGRPGVRVLRGEVDVTGGVYDLTLSFAGPALLRVDGGTWHHHGDAAVYGPRWSAARLKLPAGRHTVELRLGTYGGATDVTVLVAPVVAPPALALPEGMAALAALVANDLTGAADAALEQAGKLSSGRRFTVGLAAAARFALRDPTRPANIGRDGARSLFRRAVALDEKLARVWRDLAGIELTGERPRDASEDAERALKAAPAYWPAALTLVESLRARGMERDADRALATALEGVGPSGGCAVVEVAMRRAQELSHTAEEDRLAARLVACNAHSEALLDRVRVRGDLDGVEAALRRRLSTTTDPIWVRGELAQVRLSRGEARPAADELAALVPASPRDYALRVRLADAYLAAGERERARAILTEALRLFPTRLEVRNAARALDLPLPLDPFRLDGAAVIREFESGGRRYDAPAVLILDRTVSRVFPDGAQMVLTHNIVRVQSKDGIERWGEIAIPDGAEVLTLRTHKPDGTVREPEEIAGKPTISAPDLAPGDCVEWETLEIREATDAFAPGFLGERFYFQSLEAPLDRSEYLVVTEPGVPLDSDRRAGAPVPVVERGPGGLRVARFAARQIPQLFAERAAVPPIEWIPSVRVSSGVSLPRWSRFLADQLYGVSRSSPALRRVAEDILAKTPDRTGTHVAEAIWRWVSDHIEPEGDLFEPATFSLARGRGNRTALLLALARTAGVKAEVAFARSLAVAAGEAPFVPQEVDDFGDVLVRFPGAEGTAFVDTRLRHAPFGYLPPALSGAPFLVVGEERPRLRERASSTTTDGRTVFISARIAPDGQATAQVSEELTGWPSLEWLELVERAGDDRGKLRQDFEQRWLSQNFPGAVLGELKVDVRDKGNRGVRVTYTFSHPELAVRDAGGLKISPSFFRAQPGRRFATEPRRRTTLLLGFDVPLDLEARLDLPPGAKVLDAGESAEIAAAADGTARFAERREVRGGAAPQVIVRRQVRLPLLRVAPVDYTELAGKLRRVDPLEQAEIRVSLPPPSADGRLRRAGGDSPVN